MPKLITRLVTEAKSEMELATSSLAAGTMPLAEWQAKMEEEIKNGHLRAAAASKQNLNDPENQAWVDARLNQQLSHLDQFATDLADKDQLDGRDISRARMYADAIGQTHTALVRDKESKGNQLERRVLDPTAAHCKECEEYAAMGWVPVGTLPDIGDDCSCFTNCKCHFEYSAAAAPADAEEEAEFGGPGSGRYPAGSSGNSSRGSRVNPKPIKRQSVSRDAAKDWEDKHFDVLGGQLNETQMAVTENYVLDSDNVNGYLRGLHELQPDEAADMDAAVAVLDSAIESCKLPEAATVFRIGNKALFGPSGPKVGQIVTDKAYVSTSTSDAAQKEMSAQAAKQFASMKIELPKGSSGLLATRVRAKMAGRDEDFGNERELLLPRNSRFEVTAVNGGNVEMRLITDGKPARSAEMSAEFSAALAFFDEANVEFAKCGCLLAPLPPAAAEAIKTWAKKNINPDHLADKGIEEQPHVTVAYGFDPDPQIAMDMRKLFNGGRHILVNIAGMSLFTGGEDGSVLKLDVDSPDLHKMHDGIAAVYKLNTEFKEYKPHVTIAYLRPEFAKLYLARPLPPASWFALNKLEYSTADKQRTDILLAGGEAMFGGPGSGRYPAGSGKKNAEARKKERAEKHAPDKETLSRRDKVFGKINGILNTIYEKHAPERQNLNTSPTDYDTPRAAWRDVDHIMRMVEDNPEVKEADANSYINEAYQAAAEANRSPLTTLPQVRELSNTLERMIVSGDHFAVADKLRDLGFDEDNADDFVDMSKTWILRREVFANKENWQTGGYTDANTKEEYQAEVRERYSRDLFHAVDRMNRFNAHSFGKHVTFGGPGSGLYPAGSGGNATKEKAKGEIIRTDSRTTKIAEGIFGKGVSNEEIAAAAGAQDGARVIISSTGKFATAHVSDPAGRYSLIREFRVSANGEKTCYNDLMVVDKDHRGQGLGTKLLETQVRELVNQGFTRIDTTAGGNYEDATHPDPAQRMNGYYTWPLLGYDAEIEGRDIDAMERRGLPKEYAKEYRSAGSVRELMKMPKGIDNWFRYGAAMEMSFDLTEGSESRRALSAYIKEKTGKEAGFSMGKASMNPAAPDFNDDEIAMLEELFKRGAAPDEEFSQAAMFFAVQNNVTFDTAVTPAQQPGSAAVEPKAKPVPQPVAEKPAPSPQAKQPKPGAAIKKAVAESAAPKEAAKPNLLQPKPPPDPSEVEARQIFAVARQSVTPAMTDWISFGKSVDPATMEDARSYVSEAVLEISGRMGEKTAAAVLAVVIASRAPRHPAVAAATVAAAEIYQSQRMDFSPEEIDIEAVQAEVDRIFGSFDPDRPRITKNPDGTWTTWRKKDAGFSVEFGGPGSGRYPKGSGGNKEKEAKPEANGKPAGKEKANSVRDSISKASAGHQEAGRVESKSSPEEVKSIFQQIKDLAAKQVKGWVEMGKGIAEGMMAEAREYVTEAVNDLAYKFGEKVASAVLAIPLASSALRSPAVAAATAAAAELWNERKMDFTPAEVDPVVVQEQAERVFGKLDDDRPRVTRGKDGSMSVWRKKK